MEPYPRQNERAVLAAGKGRIELQLHGSEAVFAVLSAAYPLKLLSPRTSQERVAIAYALTYGGGLVGGDRINLSVEVHSHTTLVLLSQVGVCMVFFLSRIYKPSHQGSTKVFKTRPDRRLSSHTTRLIDTTLTIQKMDVTIDRDASFFLLPDPVTCFRAAKYHQMQTFHLVGNASVVLLDWLISGRRAMGEEWQFSRYYSLNEVWVNDERIARDAMDLQQQESTIHTVPTRSLADSLAPYFCYATLIMYGINVQDIVKRLSNEYKTIVMMKKSEPPELIWSLSLICEGKGCVVRVAGKETEAVRNWLKDALKELEDTIGTDAYRKAFGG